MPELDVLGLCEQLDGLRAAATPGPWGQHELDGSYVIGAIAGEDEWLDVADTGGRSSYPADDGTADAALIVAAVNSLPELTAAVRGLLADRDTLARVAALAEEIRGELQLARSDYANEWQRADTLARCLDRLNAIVGGAS